MKVLGQEVLILSILMMLIILYCSGAVSMQMAVASKSHSNGTQLSVTLVRSSAQNGPVNISVNDTVVASNIDVTKKSSSVIPITIPDKLVSGTIRICATAVAPAAAQICTDVQNMKNKVTIDLTKAISG
jgi:cytoskeletal protein RodZ